MPRPPARCLTLLILCLAGVVAASGCGSSRHRPAMLASIDLSNFPTTPIEGLAVDPRSGDLYIYLPGQGLLITDEQGLSKDAVPQDESDLFAGISALSFLPGGDYLVGGGSEVRIVDREDHEALLTVEVDAHLADDVRGDISAVGHDPVRDEILACTALFTRGGGLSGTRLQRFSMDGEHVESVDINVVPFSPDGIDRHPAAEGLLLVDDRTLKSYDVDADRELSFRLDEVQDASAMALDVDKGVVWVADRTTMAVFAYPVGPLLP